MITGDFIVYAHPNRKDYVAYFEEHGWKRWPATQDGWKSRQGFPSGLPGGTTDSFEELDPTHGRLALRLSGVTT